MLSLNIEMQSFELDRTIFNDADSIRVSVTTLPGEQKQAFSFDARKMKTVKPFFSVKIDEKTEKVLIVIRKKNCFGNDPIIASTVIKKGQFPADFNDSTNTELKSIDLLEPVQKIGKKNAGLNRKVVGKIELFFSLTQELPCQSNFNMFSKKRNGKGYAKVNSIFSNENNCENAQFLTDFISN